MGATALARATPVVVLGIDFHRPSPTGLLRSYVPIYCLGNCALFARVMIDGGCLSGYARVASTSWFADVRPAMTTLVYIPVTQARCPSCREVAHGIAAERRVAVPPSGGSQRLSAALLARAPGRGGVRRCGPSPNGPVKNPGTSPAFSTPTS